jgi:hypothetical protein
VGCAQESEETDPNWLSACAGDKAAANIYYKKCDDDNGNGGKLPAGDLWIALGTKELDAYYERSC